MYRPLLIAPVHVTKEQLAPRHRRKRKEDDAGTNNGQTAQAQVRDNFTHQSAQFDLEDSAFPPLPGKLKDIKFLKG